MSTTPVPDEIRKDVTIDVDREQVWAALTVADQLKRWFPTKDARVDLRPGGELYLEWDEDIATGIFDEIDPPNRLVYRWHPGGDDLPATTVEFTLDDAPDGTGTRLTVVERGFSQLPADKRDGNVEGWESELAELVEYLTTLKPRH
ncbi:MAG TPA: SRPBCC domain-containing protein [Actinomycetota bacterium]|nr:SRPBCC domain-containing protein [Actinomycetota bacterium]